MRGVLISGFGLHSPAGRESIQIQEGDELAPTKISPIQRDLYNLDVFAKVNATVQNPDGDEQYKYVLYDFDEANRYTMNIGVGAEIAQFGGTATAINSSGGSTGFSPRVSLDVSRLNFFGVGDTLSFRSRISDLEQRVPWSSSNRGFWVRPSHDHLHPALRQRQGCSHVCFPARRGIGECRPKVFKSLTAQFGFAYRRVSVSDIVIPTLLVPQLEQPVRIGIVTATLVQDRRDNPADAHRGMYNTVDFGLASNILGSQRNFGRLLLKNATYTQLTRNVFSPGRHNLEPSCPTILRPASAPRNPFLSRSASLPEGPIQIAASRSTRQAPAILATGRGGCSGYTANGFSRRRQRPVL